MSVITRARQNFDVIVKVVLQRAVDNQRVRAWQLEQQFHAVHARLPEISARIAAAVAANETKATAGLLRELSANFAMSSRIASAWARTIEVALKIGGQNG